MSNKSIDKEKLSELMKNGWSWRGSSDSSNKVECFVYAEKGGTATCNTSFDTIVDICKSDISKANALLTRNSIDNATMNLTVSAHKSTWFSFVRSLMTNTITSVRVGFIIDGSEVIYQHNPDDTVIKVT